MLEVQSLVQRRSRRRAFLDSATRLFVSTGGLAILLVLMLIFVYLLWVVAPIFKPVEVEEVQQWAFPEPPAYHLGIDESHRLAYRISNQGDLAMFSVENEVLHLQDVPLVFTQKPHIIGRSHGLEKYWIYGFDEGQVGLFQTQFKLTYEGEQSQVKFNVNYPFGDTFFQVAPVGTRFSHVAFERISDRAVIVATSTEGRTYLKFFSGEANFLTGEVQWQEEVPIQSDLIPPQADQVLVTPDLKKLLVRKANRLFVFDISNPNTIELHDGFELTRKHDSPIRSITFLSSTSSLLVLHADNRITQWFEILNQNKRRLKQIRAFDVKHGQVTDLMSESHRKVFYTGSSAGYLDIFYTTNASHLWSQRSGQGPIEALTISPRHNVLLIQQDQQLKRFSVNNEYPEISWSALWSKIWYEGYKEPEFIWQSTSGSDDFEPKFSLMPLAFGTLKAAFYALLFSVPLAIAGAIYTAYFMAPRLRKVVKPAVEIMEALPTVILGFLAGLWLAPIVEEKLITIFLMIVLLPFFAFFLSWLWQSLPEFIQHKVPDHYIIIVLIPCLVLFCTAILSLNPWIESTFLEGDTRTFITQHLGIDYDQRNALVVGIAMGFAVIPTIFSIAEDALFSVPKHLTQGSLALGATPWQTLSRIVLLTASPGIFSAVMMGLGRAVGETMIVLMATGNTPVMDLSIFQGMRTLSANIAVEMPESEIGSSHYRILFLAAFVLFAFTFCVNTIAEHVRQKLRDKYSSM